jgi:hypothetical protein
MFTRAEVYEKGLARQSRAGDNGVGNPIITTNASAGAQNITVPMIMGGVGVFTGAAGAVNYTLPTTAALIAALPDMDIGDTYSFRLCNTAAQTATIVAGDASTTLAGFTTFNAKSLTCLLTKTAAATLTLTSI